MNERRRLLLVLGAGLGTLWAAVPAIAQRQAKMPRIGFLTTRSRPASLEADYFGGLLRGLRELGYVEGKNIVIEWRFADGNNERLPGLAAELVGLKVDVIVTAGSPAARAARQATTTLPVVMAGVGDPVALGFVASLSRPGGNITGVSNLAADVSSKSLEFLRAVVPRLSRVAVLLNPSNPIDPIVLKHVQTAARPAGVSILPFEATSASQIDAAFAEIARARVGALIVAPDPFYVTQASQIAQLAAKARLAAIYSFRTHVEAGGLMSYGQNLFENYRRAATYVDKILKGAKPADLPVEQPTQIELVVNRRTAKALGLTLPQELLLRADEVIE